MTIKLGLLCRALGDPQFKLGKEKSPVDCTPEVRAVELNPGDNAIVLATDGLWDVLSDVTVVELLVEVRDCLSCNSSSQQKGMQKCQCLYWLSST